MNSFSIIGVLAVTSILASCLFGFVILATKLIIKSEVKTQYTLMKYTMIVYLVPVLFFFYRLAQRVNLLISKDFKYIALYEEDSGIILDRGHSKVLDTVFLVWLAGFFLFFLFKTIWGWMVGKKLIKSCVECRDIRITQLIHDNVQALGIKSKIKVYCCDIIKSPFVIGIRSKKIVFPNIDFDKASLNFLIKHELIHIKSHDILYRSLLELVKGIHWYNPIVIKFDRIFYCYGELACDESVLLHEDKKNRTKYAELLLSLLKEESHAKYKAEFAGGNEKFLKRRLKNIMNKKKGVNKILITITVGLFAILCPIITFAAAKGINSAENTILTLEKESNTEEERASEILMEYTKDKTLVSQPEYINVKAKGATPIDVTIAKQGEAQFSPIDLYDTSSIRVVVSADNATDEFEVGLVAEDGFTRYVTSTNGAVNHTFDISEDGNYILYILGKNSSTKIHLRGTVYVTY